MEVIMGFFSAIGEFFSSVFSTVVSLSFSEVFVITTILQVILKALGIDFKEDNPEMLGDKMLQAEAEGIVPENFDTYEEYLNEISNFELDPEKSESYTQEEKLQKFAALGISLAAEKIGENVIPLILEVLPKFSEDFRTKARIEAYIKEFDGAFDKLADYFKDSSSLTFSEIKDIEKRLVDLEKKLNPDADADSILSKLDEQRHRVENG